MKQYEVCDLSKSLLSKDTIIIAKSPLEAAKKYIKSLGENKTIKRDLFNQGRLVVNSRTASYVYEVI